MRLALQLRAWALCLAPGFLFPAMTQAGPVSNQGTEFWLTFPNQYQTQPQALDLFILSQTGASGMVSVAGLSYGQAFSVAANSATTVVVPESAMLSASDGVQNLAIHVTSNSSVNVIGLEYANLVTDGYLALPVGAIGTQYWVASYTADVVSGGTTAIGSSEFAVVASQDSTSVTITPSITVGSHPVSVAYTVTLNQWQTYELQADILGNDLTGTQVTSNLPVAFFDANACADVPVSYTTCNMLLEEEIPLTTWGTAFVTVPLATRSSDTFRYLSSANGTTVNVNGAAVTTLNQGQFYEQMLSTASYITSNNPILVMQYSNSHTYDNVAIGDPSQITVPPVSDYGTAYQLAAPATVFPANYLNVAAPSAEAGSITFDGALLPAGSFSVVGASGFSAAQVTIGTGYHQLSGPQPFGVESYGFANHDAYGYPGGLVFVNLPTLTPTPTPTVTPTPTITPTPIPTLTPTPVCVIKVWPVPFNPPRAVGGVLKLDCLQPNDQVSYYTLSGELVFQTNSPGAEYDWNGTNTAGIPVAPGIYFYTVVRNGQVVKRDKFILVRL